MLFRSLVPRAGPLSMLRTLRIMRLLRVIKFMPGLRRVVEALLRSLPGISAIALLMGLIFYVAAVMATVMFGQAFPEWFGSIGRSLYSLFQIMTLTPKEIFAQPNILKKANLKIPIITEVFHKLENKGIDMSGDYLLFLY